VALDDRVFGKPMDDAEAITMLESLSGKTHRVFSGMALIHQDERVCRERFVCTSVTFRSLGADEIRAYVRTGEPFDKAGGYGIQGLGAFLVRSIEGSYTNVVGLPLGETLDLLLDHEIIKPR
jgi:septum formation protein